MTSQQSSNPRRDILMHLFNICAAKNWTQRENHDIVVALLDEELTPSRTEQLAALIAESGSVQELLHALAKSRR